MFFVAVVVVAAVVVVVAAAAAAVAAAAGALGKQIPVTTCQTLSKALDQLTPAVIRRSWDATGIPRALWADVPSALPMVEGRLYFEYLNNCLAARPNGRNF